MRRHELERLHIQLPVLATIALGGLPGPPEWSARMMSIGVDVVASGALHDTPETYTAAAAAAPFRAVKATAPADTEALAAAGARIIETAGTVPEGCIASAPRSHDRRRGRGQSEVEDPNAAARLVVDVAREMPPSGLWVVASPGSTG